MANYLSPIEWQGLSFVRYLFHHVTAHLLTVHLKEEPVVRDRERGYNL